MNDRILWYSSYINGVGKNWVLDVEPIELNIIGHKDKLMRISYKKKKRTDEKEQI